MSDEAPLSEVTLTDKLDNQTVSDRDSLMVAWETGQSKEFHHYIEQLHAADIALVVGEIRAEQPVRFIEKIHNKALIPEILLNLDANLRIEILIQLPLKQVANYLAQLESDDRLALIENFPEKLQYKLFALLTPKIRDNMISGLQFDTDTAGRIMRLEFVSIAENWSVGDVIDYLRGYKANIPQFHNIMVINKKYQVVGVLEVSKLLANKRNVKITDIMNDNPHLLHVDMDEQEIVQMFRKYGLIENPVVNAEGAILGTITLDDVIDLVDEQGEEDLLNLLGVGAHGFYDRVLRTSWQRGTWLFVNLLTAIATSIAIGLFEDVLQKIVVLAVLMPINASMGGNAGMQSLAVTVRALALGYLTPATWSRMVLKESYVGIINGLVFALLIAICVYFWFGETDIALIIAVAMLVNLVLATFFGALVPLLLQAIGQDPTTGSAVILTTITDILGFCLFLGMASWFLL